MPTSRGDPLDRVARAITDGKPVDWDELNESHPDLRTRFDNLRLIQNLADSSRQPAPEPGGTASEQGKQIESPVPFQWGSLEVVEKIGEGSFGEVYRAFDPLLQREVALKLRRLRGEETQEAFFSHIEEARRLARVRHPHVLAVHGVEVHGDRAGLWTDFIRGETLEERIASGDPMTAPGIVAIGIDLCQALAAVHEVGLVHGDVKAANVMREPDGRIVLMDFGAGSAIREISGGMSDAPAGRSSSGEGSFAGTPMVMAPELFQGENPSVASDLYALGVLLFRLASGRYPLEAHTREQLLEAHRTKARIPLADLRPDLPPGVVEVVTRALAPETSARFASASAMEAALCGAADREASLPAGRRTNRRAGRPNNLPVPETRFVGRERELTDLRRMIRDSSLVALVGPGGTGKTRLALEIATAVLDSFADGVWWIELAPLEREEQILEELVRALEVRLERYQTLREVLVEYVRGRSLLVILDNCEHMLAACRLFSESLLQAAPHVRILATSRERLGSLGETAYPLAPLGLPAQGSRRRKEEGLEIAASEAVRLFIDRAYRSRPAFALTRANAPSVARICRRLDGIPLAIELAAARIKAMSTAELESRLGESFRILSGVEEGRPAHHQTLRTLIAWSYRLLDGGEQALLRRLSVFSGRWTLQSAEKVCCDPGGGAGHIGETPIVDLLTGLVEKSLVLFEPPATDQLASGSNEEDRSGYRMLEMVRQFAADALSDSGEEETFGNRHLDHYLALSEEANQHLAGPDQDSWILRLEREHDNFRAALVWCGRPGGDAAKGLRTAVALRGFWLVRRYGVEGLAVLKLLLGRTGFDPSLRGRGLVSAASLAWVQGHASEARRFCEDALALRRSGEDDRMLAPVLAMLGTIESDQGNLAEATRLLEEALVLRRRHGPATAMPPVLVNLGVVYARAGDLDLAGLAYEEALAIAREQGNRSTEGVCLGNLAATARDRGNLEAALVLAEESIAILRSTENRMNLGGGLRTCGLVWITRGQLHQAREALQEDLRVQEEYGDRVGLLDSLTPFVSLLIAEERMEKAARLSGALDGLRQRMHVPVFPLAQEERGQELAQMRAALGPDRFASLLASGRGMALEAAMSLALEEPGTAAGTPEAKGPRV